MKKILSLFLTIILLLSVFTFSTNAASSATVSFSKNTVTIGDNVVVTVTVNPGKKMYGVQFVLNYNEDILKYKSGSGSGGAGSLMVVESPTGTTKFTASFTFTAIKNGTSAISVADCLWSDGVDEKKFGGASANITVKDKALSADARLKSLYLGGVNLSPAFAMAKTSYTAKVPYEKTKVNVYATTNDKNAKVTSVVGNSNLKVGKNNIVVTVQAHNGTQKKYQITVTRLEKVDKLESSDNTETDDKPEDNNSSLQASVAGITYTIAAKIPAEYKKFNGFNITADKYNGQDIEVLADENNNYKIYLLKASDSETLVPYIFDSELEEFEKLKYINVGGNFYIFSKIPADFKAPSNLYTSNVEIKDFLVECLADSNMSDFYYVYCYSNGNFGLYRYDNLECTLQRFPDFEIASDVVETDNNDNFITRFNSLTTNGKIIILCLLLAFIGILSLLILLIVSLINKSRNKAENFDLYYEDDDFEDVQIVTADNTEE